MINYDLLLLIFVAFRKPLFLILIFYVSLASRWRGPCYWSLSIGRGGGSIIFVSELFDGNVSAWRKDTDGRVISLLLELSTVKINLISIYAPTTLTDRKTFFDSLH